MDWQDDAIVLTARPHGETSAVVTVLTREHGRHAGLARGARNSNTYQPGNRVSARWRGRLKEHLGFFTCELKHSAAARLMDNPRGLSALASACSTIDSTVPEREPLEKVHRDLDRLITRLECGESLAAYACWERDLLADLGFGLDLSRCAVKGDVHDLVYVSPRTGRAVSRGAGAAYHDKLLTLPAFLLPPRADNKPEPNLPDPPLADIVMALRLTGYFLDRHVFSLHTSHTGKRAAGGPAARQRLIEHLTRQSETKGRPFRSRRNAPIEHLTRQSETKGEERP